MRSLIRTAAGVATLTAFISLTACSTPVTSAIEINYSDVTSAHVSTSEIPQYSQVVALANGAAEIIDALGLKKILVGRDIASTDASLKSVPIVTSGHQVIAEKIIALHPDLVIIDSSVGPSRALDALRKAGINLQIIHEVWSVGEIATKVREVAGLIGVPTTGAKLADNISSSIVAASTSLSGSPRIAFLYLRGGSSIYLLGGKGSGADSLISALGGIDVGAQINSKPFAALTSESFARQQPDILLVMVKGLESVGGVEGLVALPGIAQTPAGKAKRIIAVDDSLLLSFGPRTPQLLEKLAAAVKELK
jgi:iron complex transport system substrate-binding protein